MENSRKRLAILGSTGSIGTQTLDVVSQHRDRFEVVMLAANTNVDLLSSQAVEFGASDAVICDASRYDALNNALSGTSVRTHSGIDAVCELVESDKIDVVVAAMVGFSGLKPTLAALAAGKTVALANKETLVAAGNIVTALTKSVASASVIPVDSEHSAIFQCLQKNVGEHVARIHLTASGGPFRTFPREKIASMKSADALKHPNWNMGTKVTIDSATMMNKGLEVIEAKWLFDVEPSNIKVIVHPQSIIHSMVEYDDGAVIAQLGCPDMRQPIQYALSWPQRMTLNNRKLDFAGLGHLDFFAPDTSRFPCLELAFEAIGKGGTFPCIMNAANEVAVAAFLQDRIGFYDIPDIITKTMDALGSSSSCDVEGIFESHAQALQFASKLL